MPFVATIDAFAYRKMISRSFFTMDRKNALRISVYGTPRLCFFLSLFL